MLCYIHFTVFYLGLTAQTSDPIHFKHVTAMAEYAFRLKQQLANVNEHSFNNFQLRIGKIQNDKNFKVSNSNELEMFPLKNGTKMVLLIFRNQYWTCSGWGDRCK